MCVCVCGLNYFNLFWNKYKGSENIPYFIVTQKSTLIYLEGKF